MHPAHFTIEKLAQALQNAETAIQVLQAQAQSREEALAAVTAENESLKAAASQVADAASAPHVD